MDDICVLTNVLSDERDRTSVHIARMFKKCGMHRFCGCSAHTHLSATTVKWVGGLTTVQQYCSSKLKRHKQTSDSSGSNVSAIASLLILSSMQRETGFKKIDMYVGSILLASKPITLEHD